ncbi:hypothetical protein ElyMa_002216900 [Elysia marginata]|uniref:Uncharacterized protein n=1 Tax=Elysia marginata TaxID=1093978 RepID=A0AAV4FWC5_9GAST|nr:hypothetical protein ElyMa_002216900 [Elysia marginata]
MYDCAPLSCHHVFLIAHSGLLCSKTPSLPIGLTSLLASTLCTPSPRHPGKPALPSDAVTEPAHVSHISSMKPLECEKTFGKSPTVKLYSDVRGSVSEKFSPNFVDTKVSRLAPDEARCWHAWVLDSQTASKPIFSPYMCLLWMYSLLWMYGSKHYWWCVLKVSERSCHRPHLDLGTHDREIEGSVGHGEGGGKKELSQRSKTGRAINI